MFALPFSQDDEKIKWAGSQADFISLVEFFEATRGFKSKNGSATADEIGELFLKIVDLDLSPYPDFHAMRVSVSASSEPVDIAQKLLDHMHKEGRLSHVLEGTGIEPSQETQANHIFSWMMANNFISKLSQYIDLPNK